MREEWCVGWTKRVGGRGGQTALRGEGMCEAVGGRGERRELRIRAKRRRRRGEGLLFFGGFQPEVTHSGTSAREREREGRACADRSRTEEEWKPVLHCSDREQMVARSPSLFVTLQITSLGPLQQSLRLPVRLSPSLLPPLLPPPAASAPGFLSRLCRD